MEYGHNFPFCDTALEKHDDVTAKLTLLPQGGNRRSDSRHKGSVSTIAEPKQEEASFSSVAVPGHGGTNGTTVETPPAKKEKNPADGVCSLDGMSSGVLVKSVTPSICVSSSHWDLRGFTTTFFLLDQ